MVRKIEPNVTKFGAHCNILDCLGCRAHQPDGRKLDATSRCRNRAVALGRGFLPGIRPFGLVFATVRRTWRELKYSRGSRARKQSAGYGVYIYEAEPSIAQTTTNHQLRERRASKALSSHNALSRLSPQPAASGIRQLHHKTGSSSSSAAAPLN